MGVKSYLYILMMTNHEGFLCVCGFVVFSVDCFVSLSSLVSSWTLTSRQLLGATSILTQDENCESAFTCHLGDLCFEIVEKNFECVIRPEGFRTVDGL